MSAALLGHAWRAYRLRLLVVAAALGLWGALLPIVFDAFGEEIGKILDSGLIPEQFMQFTEFGGGDLFSLAGSVSLGLHPSHRGRAEPRVLGRVRGPGHRRRTPAGHARGAPGPAAVASAGVPDDGRRDRPVRGPVAGRADPRRAGRGGHHRPGRGARPGQPARCCGSTRSCCTARSGPSRWPPRSRSTGWRRPSASPWRSSSSRTSWTSSATCGRTPSSCSRSRCSTTSMRVARCPACPRRRTSWSWRRSSWSPWATPWSSSRAGTWPRRAERASGGDPLRAARGRCRRPRERTTRPGRRRR